LVPTDIEFLANVTGPALAFAATTGIAKQTAAATIRSDNAPVQRRAIRRPANGEIE
jgi:hypothetical protein